MRAGRSRGPKGATASVDGGRHSGEAASVGDPTSAAGPSASVRIAVAGAGGRMGQALIEAVLAASDLALAGALDLPGSVAQGTDAGARFGRTTGIRVAMDVDAVLRGVDVLVDFT